MTVGLLWKLSTGTLLSTVLAASSLAAEPAHPHRHAPLPNVTEYLDRLDRPERDQDQKPMEVIAALALTPGMTVADLGSGSGYFTRRFVEAVTERGTVYAIDVEPAALAHVKQTLAGIGRSAHVTFIHAKPDDPGLPPQSVDLVFICNTYHHLEQHAAYLHRLKSALKPGGRIAVIDFHPDERSGDLGFPKDHLITAERLIADMAAAGFHTTATHAFLPKQYFLEFSPQ